MYFEKKGYRIVLVGEDGKEIDRLRSLPSCEDPEIKKILEKEGIAHLVLGARNYYYDSEYMGLETIRAPFHDGENNTSKFLEREILTQETVDRANELWKRFWKNLKGKKK